MAQPTPPSRVEMGDRVQLRKAHPCGNDVFVVVRLGTDVGLVCAGCGHRVMLARGLFVRRLKRVLPPPPSERPAAGV